MSIINCCVCDNYKDSDYGCFECKTCENGLICQDCHENMSIEEHVKVCSCGEE